MTETLLLSIASLAAPIALGVVSIGAATLAEKVAPKDEE